ncbi:MAG: type II toxin-antitoxin system mRNA interferase toxin, RelE/StbE family [Pseudomonadota bacterium]
MTLWRVEESPEVVLQLAQAPAAAQRKYAVWHAMVEIVGPFLPGKGWATEALKGPLKGFFSARLDRKWRIIFEVEGRIRVVAVLSVTPHLYARIRR